MRSRSRPIQVPIQEGLRSTAELQDFVRKHGEHGRVRPIGALHSSNNQVCVEHELDRAVRLGSLKLDPDYVDVRVSADTGPTGTMIYSADIDASLTLAVLNERLSALGYTLGFGSVFFRGVTVAGALATGAHGSSLDQSSVLSSRLLAIRMFGSKKCYIVSTVAESRRAALGAIFHLIQDSYAQGHVQRGSCGSNPNRPQAVIRVAPVERFLAYTAQKKRAHSASDRWPKTEMVDSEMDHPVVAGAKVLEMIATGKKSDALVEYLGSRVLRLAVSYQPSASEGECYKKGLRRGRT